jgi:hypothetical protein
MKKRLLNILIIDTIITVIRFTMDGDVKEPSIIMQSIKLVLMLTIVFCINCYYLQHVSFCERQISKSDDYINQIAFEFKNSAI